MRGSWDTTANQDRLDAIVGTYRRYAPNIDDVTLASVPLEPLLDLEGVHTDVDLSKAVDTALAADRPDPAAVASSHGWGPRMAHIFEALGMELEQDPEATPIHVTQRPVVHWPPEQRRL